MLDVIQTSSTSEQIESDVEDVIGFIIGQVKSQHLCRPIELFADAKNVDQFDDGGQSTAVDRLLFLSEFKFCGGGTNHR